MRLKGKIAMVTGGGTGLGFEIARLFAQEGAKVVIASIDGVEAAVNTIKEAGGEAIGVVMDITSEAEVNAGVLAAVKAFGKIDILVSNAGIQHIEAIDKLALSDWNKMLSVYLDGAFLSSKACLQHMYPAGAGCIILMGSVHSKVASKLKAPYVTAKHGLIGLGKTIAKEGAEHGVRCNVIWPGFVRTALVDKQIPEQAKTLGINEEDVGKKVMLGETVDGQFTTKENIAQVALFFASFESTALTGQSLVASHGWFME